MYCIVLYCIVLYVLRYIAKCDGAYGGRGGYTGIKVNSGIQVISGHYFISQGISGIIFRLSCTPWCTQRFVFTVNKFTAFVRKARLKLSVSERVREFQCGGVGGRHDEEASRRERERGEA